MELKHPTLAEALQRVLGKSLLSADFVEDYVQLKWEGAILTAYTMPEVLQGGVTYGPESPVYRHRIFGLEGQIVRSVEVILGDRVSVYFPNTVLSVSLRNADYVGPEAIQFEGGDGPSWVA